MEKTVVNMSLKEIAGEFDIFSKLPTFNRNLLDNKLVKYTIFEEVTNLTNDELVRIKEVEDLYDLPKKVIAIIETRLKDGSKWKSYVTVSDEDLENKELSLGIIELGDGESNTDVIRTFAMVDGYESEFGNIGIQEVNGLVVRRY